ncbi:MULTISPECIES: exodeoxyribonuclease VII small subunit [Chitinibacter]|uniref:exodeoxyribonuclease VII small subunit n=1 Tax=Chitinibacter TaxID=230666 RepID=UPI0003FB2120|nr:MULTISPECIES: exodeoxyribonuclease VII small subunit [Chitinibacter]
MAKAAKTQLPEHYEAGVAELDQLISQLESGQLPLEQSLAAYQRGIELLRFCEGKLAAAEQQIKVLEAGELKPLDEQGA